ncbi:MAG TPA: glucose 1-dehydrogenase [Thermoanaerobaculia bacterium]|nr:glucose 1-dehydrogenase [Thermoanaerobaculia bacterium]
MALPDGIERTLGTELFSLGGKVAVVTGASSGLGVTFARALAGAGASVVVAARRLDRIERLAEELRAGGADAHAVGCDVAQQADVDRLVAATRERFGRVDVLVNNAGVSSPAPAELEPLEVWQSVLDVNLTGVFLCSQRFGRVMLEQGSGVIVNVASVLGVVASGQIPQASYAATKAAVVNLTRELAAQWARRGVRVNAIGPGWFPSEMTEQMFDNEHSLGWIRKRTPMGRPGESWEIAGVLLFLASDASAYVTGQTILVDGGWTIV